MTQESIQRRYKTLLDKNEQCFKRDTSAEQRSALMELIKSIEELTALHEDKTLKKKEEDKQHDKKVAEYSSTVGTLLLTISIYRSCLSYRFSFIERRAMAGDSN